MSINRSAHYSNYYGLPDGEKFNDFREIELRRIKSDFDYLLRHVSHATPRRILDIGCGYGFFLSLCDAAGYETYGIDIYDDLVAVAARSTRAKMFVCASPNQYPFDDGTFDVITCFDVVEHLEDARPLYRAALRLLSPGGVFLLTTPNGGFAYRLRSLPFVGVEDNCPTHINVQARKYWRELGINVGFHVSDESNVPWLSHVRGLYRLGASLSNFGVDVSRVPVVRSFTQAIRILFKKPIAAVTLPSTNR